MNKQYTFVCILLTCLCLSSCQSHESVPAYFNIEATEQLLNKERELHPYPNIGDGDIFDFANINGAPLSEKNHDVKEIIKMYSTTWSIDELHYPIVIDIEQNEIYVEPNIGLYGIEFETDRIKVNDIHKVHELFEKYNVLDWQNYYSNVKDYHSYEDGAYWKLVVQYADGTIEIFRGSGTDFDEIIPHNYYDFMNQLGEYVSRHLND